MAKKNRFKGLKCVYCGKDATTGDHTPPEKIFGESSRKNLIEVPSCRTCNNGASNDDEYFRTVLSLLEATESHPDVQSNLPSVYRALSNPKKAGFRAAIIKTIELQHQVTPAGLYFRTAPTLSLDMKRLHSVTQRTTRGLYYHERGFGLPDSHDVRSYFAMDFMRDVTEIGIRLQGMAAYALSKSSKTVGPNGAFTYWYSFMEEQPDYDPTEHAHLSVWLLRFYDSVDFLCTTQPVVGVGLVA